MFESEITNVAMVLLFTGIFIMQILNYVRNNAGTGKPLSPGVIEAIEDRQRDREYMERLERAYQTAMNNERLMFDKFADLLRVIAPLTTFTKLDDALSKFIEDVRTPGPIETPEKEVEPDPNEQPVSSLRI